MDLIKKLASRKLGAAIGGGVVLSAASPEAIWPTAFVAAAYILGQAIVDTWGNRGAIWGKRKRDGSEGPSMLRFHT